MNTPERITKHTYRFADRFVDFAEKKGMKNFPWMLIRFMEKWPDVFRLKEDINYVG